MPIAFFITDKGEFFFDLEATSIDDERFHWLSLNHIDLGRRSSFIIRSESPRFNSVSEAEHWLAAKSKMEGSSRAIRNAARGNGSPGREFQPLYSPRGRKSGDTSNSASVTVRSSSRVISGAISLRIIRRL